MLLNSAMISGDMFDGIGPFWPFCHDGAIGSFPGSPGTSGFIGCGPLIFGSYGVDGPDGGVAGGFIG